MHKADIVTILEDIAVLLELKGDNPFKIRAYMSGARVLETMEEDLDHLITNGHLGAVKGIGTALVDKIETLHTTGELEYYTKLRASVAPGLIEMLEIPGLGGKKVKRLHDALGIDCPRSVPLKCDNQSTIKQSLNQVDQRRCRYLGMKTHFLRQQCHAGHLSLSYVPSASQKGDIFTKCLPTAQHEPIRRSLNTCMMTTQQFMDIYDSPGKLDSTQQLQH